MKSTHVTMVTTKRTIKGGHAHEPTDEELDRLWPAWFQRKAMKRMDRSIEMRRALRLHYKHHLVGLRRALRGNRHWSEAELQARLPDLLERFDFVYASAKSVGDATVETLLFCVADAIKRGAKSKGSSSWIVPLILPDLKDTIRAIRDIERREAA